MGEFNYETKILSDYVWADAVAKSERVAVGERLALVNLSQSSCFICAVGFRKQLEQRSIRCNRPGNEMMPKCPVSMNLLISVCQTPVYSPMLTQV